MGTAAYGGKGCAKSTRVNSERRHRLQTAPHPGVMPTPPPCTVPGLRADIVYGGDIQSIDTDH